MFAGCLTPDGKGADTLREKGGTNLHVVPLDVTDDDSVGGAVELIKQKLAGSSWEFNMIKIVKYPMRLNIMVKNISIADVKETIQKFALLYIYICIYMSQSNIVLNMSMHTKI